MQAAIKALHIGEYVQLKEGGPVWIRGPYCPDIKKYELQKADDMNRVTYRKGSTLVFHGFTY